MSSRLMPPKVGSRAFTIATILSGSFSFSSMSKTSMPANLLKRTPFPSMTGLPPSAPMSPSPSTAVPFDTTATRLPLPVYLYASSGSFSMARQGRATPGVYASERSRCVMQGFEVMTSSLPGRGFSWYS